MKKLFLLALLFISIQVQAQNNEEEKAVIATIQQLFDGMRQADSSMVRNTFHPEARLQSAFTNKEGQAVLNGGEIDKFVIQIGTPHEAVYDEKIWSYEVRIDGILASVWTEYTFYVGEKMSHCGVNAFHLFKGKDGWKITQITDTRRRSDCKEE